MPLWKRLLKATAQHGMGTAWHVWIGIGPPSTARGRLPRFGFFRLLRGHSRRLLTRMLLRFGMCSGIVLMTRETADCTEYELTLKLKSVFFSVVTLCLYCVFFFWFSVGDNSLKSWNSEIPVLKYLKNICLLSFRRWNRVWSSPSSSFAQNTLRISIFVLLAFLLLKEGKPPHAIITGSSQLSMLTTVSNGSSRIQNRVR